MQFHFDGYVIGDPDLAPASLTATERGSGAGLPATTDVLIVGCGPAGLTLGAQLAAFPDLELCVVDQRPGPLERGQADGVACRTVEMFNAFGFAERVLREAYWVNETTFWRGGSEAGTGICRAGRVQDTEDGLSEFPHVILNQARVHQFYLDCMKRAPGRIEPHYNRKLVSLTQNTDGEHPITAQFETRTSDSQLRVETVRARYAAGCDGARSTVRSQLGLELKGDSANHAWGVLDLLAVTDFPDIRLKSIINPADGGSVVLIPREGGFLVRIYVELGKLEHHERVGDRKFVASDIVAAANRAFAPYTIDVRDIAWWSVYEIGQRICDRFDDVPQTSDSALTPRIFIAGDACHTHSPKAGQGMNVSMQDAFNLGWKLAAVLQGQSAPRLLKTYSQERRSIAQELIDFDKEWSSLLSAASSPGSDVDPATVQDYFVRHGRYTAGTATCYAPGLITGMTRHQHLAPGFQVGMRLHSAPVVRLADGKPMQLGHVIEADGRWRLMAFAPGGGVADSMQAIARLCSFLQDSPMSPVIRYTPRGADADSVIDVRAIVPAPFRDVPIAAVPPFLMPLKGRFKLKDYEKVFCLDPAGERDIYAMRGIDRTQGCMIVVRPDQYVSQVLPLDATHELAEFFAGFMLER